MKSVGRIDSLTIFNLNKRSPGNFSIVYYTQLVINLGWVGGWGNLEVTNCSVTPMVFACYLFTHSEVTKMSEGGGVGDVFYKFTGGRQI